MTIHMQEEETYTYILYFTPEVQNRPINSQSQVGSDPLYIPSASHIRVMSPFREYPVSQL